ncbi:MAG: hypothetical protein F4X19_03955 [Acidobacteria bacterium]|nr:hypothetical protein [Acidobacteriota bacterium]
MYLRLIAAALCLAAPLSAQSTEAVTEPKLLSHFPLGGQQGTTFDLKVSGAALQGTHAVWFEGGELSASILKLEKLQAASEEKDKEPEDYLGKEVKADHRAVLRVRVPKTASLGLHLFRMVTPRGLSNALGLQVVSDPIISETARPHQTAEDSQYLSVPAVVNGRLSEKGQRDFYAFRVSRGEELLFAVRSDLGPSRTYQAQAGITLYQRSDSWFDPSRVVRLAVSGPALSWEPFQRYERTRSTGRFALFQRISHRFEAPGRYFLSVGTFTGTGDPNHGYQIRIVRGRSSAPRQVLGKLAHPDPGDWLERDSATLRQLGSFQRPLEADRLALLHYRSGRAPFNGKPSAPAESVSSQGNSSGPSSDHASRIETAPEVEPNNSFDRPGTVKIPGLIEGRIQTPGDIDLFRFRAEAGQKLAFEIETPEDSLPHFNPWLKLLDGSGNELVSNIYMEYGGDGDDVNKTVERKTVFTIEQTGSYFLQIRELTSVQGGPRFRYRLLVRPQVPHLGRVEISLGVTPSLSTLIDKTDRINLEAGQAREMVVVCEKEEGFQGNVLLTVDNLPPGVQAWVSTAAGWTETLMRGIQYRPLGVEVVSPRHHRPQRSATTLVFWASPDAPITGAPRFLELKARPVVDGWVGPALPAGRIPFLAVRPAEETQVMTSRR